MTKQGNTVENLTFKPPSLPAARAPVTEPLWTVEDVAHYLRLEPETVRGMARRGEIPALKVGRVWRFRRSDFKGFFQENGCPDKPAVE